MNRMTTAPMIQAQIAPGPVSSAARQAPNSQPDPMIEPRPVNISAIAPTWRRMANSLDMDGTPRGETIHGGTAADDRRLRDGSQRAIRATPTRRLRASG